MAEIRIVVGGREHQPAPDVSRDGELVWELRRRLAWSGGTLADIADTLESRGGELDSKARGLLQDELYAVEADPATVKTLLSDPSTGTLGTEVCSPASFRRSTTTAPTRTKTNAGNRVFKHSAPVSRRAA